MAILPLPQFEADVAELEREQLIESLRCKGHDPEQLASLETGELKTLDAKKKPSTLVVRYGRMKMIGEFPYHGSMTPGCGSKLIVRTHRGTEMGEMLTSTCPNSGCGSSVSRQEMLEYIENSGGRQYPFSSDGKVIRVATKEDMDTQAKLEQSSHGLKMRAKAVAESMKLPMKIVEAEPIVGGERLTVYYTSEERIDFRDLVRELGSAFGVRVDMRQVGARDEARLTADYEKCGQYCCCKNFLKVLKPISMKSAKVQKATLDPVKISGRCGRLMCCLRYEDETYDALSKRLPRRKARVGTPDGDGTVVSTQILTQLVLVRFDDAGEDQAYPVEEIGKVGERPESSGPAREIKPVPPLRSSERRGGRSSEAAPDRKRGRGDAPAREPVATSSEPPATGESRGGPIETGGEGQKKKKRRRRRRKSGGEGVEAQARQSGADTPPTDDAPAGPPRPSGDRSSEQAGEQAGDGSPARKKKRRRRRRRKPGADGGSPAGGGDGSGGGSPSGDGGGGSA